MTSHQYRCDDDVTRIQVRDDDVNDHAPRICLRPQRHASQSHANLTLHPAASRQKSVGGGAVECRNASSVTVVAETGVDRNGSFVAHATVTDADSQDNGRFACRLQGPRASHFTLGLGLGFDCRLRGPRASHFTLRRLYATEFVITTAVRLADVAAEPETDVDGGGPDAPGRRVVGEFALVCHDHGDPAMTSLIQVQHCLIRFQCNVLHVYRALRLCYEHDVPLSATLLDCDNIVQQNEEIDT